MIEAKSLDAVPGHKALVNGRLIELAVQRGSELGLSIGLLGL